MQDLDLEYCVADEGGEAEASQRLAACAHAPGVRPLLQRMDHDVAPKANKRRPLQVAAR